MLGAHARRGWCGAACRCQRGALALGTWRNASEVVSFGAGAGYHMTTHNTLNINKTQPESDQPNQSLVYPQLPSCRDAQRRRHAAPHAKRSRSLSNSFLTNSGPLSTEQTGHSGRRPQVVAETDAPGRRTHDGRPAHPYPTAAGRAEGSQTGQPPSDPTDVGPNRRRSPPMSISTNDPTDAPNDSQDSGDV